MKYNTYTFNNGLRLIHLPDDSPVVYCGFRIKVGARDEVPGEEGLAHFCEHVTFKGTQRRSALQVLNRLESVGGDLQAFTTKEDTTFYAAVLHAHLGRAVELLTDMVFHSIYPEAELEKEKEVVCDEIESYQDSPAELIYDEFENILFKGHPLGHHILGTTRQVRDFKRADVIRFTELHYRPDNTVFFVYGGSMNEMAPGRKIFRQLAGIPASSPSSSTRRTLLQVPSFEGGGHRLTIERDTHQAHVMVGTRVCSIHDDRRLPLFLLNNLLGGPGLNARLNLSLRERRGLVYAVESSLVCYADTGTWGVYLGCDPHDVERCLRLIRGELRRVSRLPLSSRRLAAAKCQLKGQLGVACDHRESFALDFAKGYLHDGWQRDLTTLYRQIDAVTAEQIRQVASEYFTPDRLLTLVIH